MNWSKIPLKKTFGFLIFLSIVLSLFTAFKSHMNNWLIFRASFDHLIDGASLYVHYPSEHQDLFKYSPTFAFFMAPLAFLPAWLGACLWNLFGALLFILALIKLPLENGQRQGVFWISLPEFIGSTQGFQSNIHVVSMLMLFWVYLEKEKLILSAFNLWGCFFIKVFGILGSCLFIFDHYSISRPKFLGKNILVHIKVFLVLFVLPAIFVGWDSLLYQYQEWGRLLKMDSTADYGFSIMGVIHGFTGLEFQSLPIQALGGLSLLVAFFIGRKADQTGRLLGLIAICYFMVLFNHKSESPTFIIAMMAFGIHQALMKQKHLVFSHPKIRWSLIVFTLVCVSLLYSDLFKQYKKPVFDVYSVKAWPFILLYPLALVQIVRNNKVIKGG